MQVFPKMNVKQVPKISSDELPEEIIVAVYSDHIRSVQNQLLETILEHHPSFFEQLVVELLLNMGYGYDEDSGVVTGGSHDGGIDGIISEDKLGLDQIYLQAKRNNSNNKVTSIDVQAFVGAMKNIQKGVFITTSEFTKDAITYIESQQQKVVRLINGRLLTEFMIKHGGGVTIVEKMELYQIDNDYFAD